MSEAQDIVGNGCGATPGIGIVDPQGPGAVRAETADSARLCAGVTLSTLGALCSGITLSTLDALRSGVTLSTLGAL